MSSNSCVSFTITFLQGRLKKKKVALVVWDSKNRFIETAADQWYFNQTVDFLWKLSWTYFLRAISSRGLKQLKQNISVFECRSLLMKASQADEHFWTCTGKELEELEKFPVNQSVPGSRYRSRVEVEWVWNYGWWIVIAHWTIKKGW